MAFHFIGDHDTALGFEFAGVTCANVSSDAEAAAELERALADKKIKVLVVTEKIAAALDDRLTAHRLTAQPPFIVEVPDVWNTKVERKSMQEMIQEAVGIKIARKDNKSSG